MFWEMIAVCSEIHIKHKNSLWGQNEELLNVKIRLTYSKQRALRVQGILRKGTLDRHRQPTLPHLRSSWGVQEQRTKINGTTCNKNCWSDTTPRPRDSKSHTNTPCGKMPTISEGFKMTEISSISVTEISSISVTPRPLQEVFTAHGWQNPEFEASFFSTGNLCAQTIEWIAM